MSYSQDSLNSSLLRNRVVEAGLAIAALICLVLVVYKSTRTKTEAIVPRPQYTADGKLPDGVYALLHEGLTQNQAKDLNERHHIFEVHTEDGEVELVAISMSSYLPLQLADTPVLANGENGHPMIGLKLARHLEPALERFTGQNKRIAIVLDDEIVTRHKVHGPITGGEIMITRCTDEKCEVIYAKLTD
ncbi:MAG: hypothetical protein IH910_10060 [Proteobacteria bacterium]|nr:hypothetical protein [Pseudomonadota bacterium]